MTLAKAEIAVQLCQSIGLTNRESREMVDAFYAEIISCLERGEPVKLSGYGIFDVRNKDERPGRNPKTGEPVPISARRVVTFHASNKLKDAVDSSSYLALPESKVA